MHIFYNYKSGHYNEATTQIYVNASNVWCFQLKIIFFRELKWAKTSNDSLLMVIVYGNTQEITWIQNYYHIDTNFDFIGFILIR